MVYSPHDLQTRKEIAHYFLSAPTSLDRAAQNPSYELGLIARFLVESAEAERYDPALIETELNYTKTLLSSQEAELEAALITVEQLRGKLQMLQSLLEKHRSNTLILEAGGKRERAPMDMLRPRFKGRKLSDVILQILESSESPLTPKDIAYLIYQTDSVAEFDRARSSLAAELRLGAKGDSPRWRKIGRSAYSSLLLNVRQRQ